MRFDFVRRQPVLKRSPLTLVICQVRFPRQMGISESDVKPIQREVAERYPLVQVGRSANLILGPAGVAPMNEPEPIFHFRSEDEAWTLTVTPDSASLETNDYHDFHDFLCRWIETVGVVLKVLDVRRQDRIGLRYVNEQPCPLRPDLAQLAEIVRSELIGVVGRHDQTRRLLQSMQELRFEQAQGVCTLRHGLVPRSETEGSYVLDFDAYDETAQSFDPDAQARLLAAFNHRIFDLFRWSVPEARFTSFEPEEVPDA